MTEQYITYNEYKALADNPVSEEAFDKLYLRAKIKLDYYTFDRIANMDPIPEEVKLLMCDLITTLNHTQSQSQSLVGLTSYSNGIESFGFSDGEKSYTQQLESSIYSKIKEYLAKYPDLLCRMVSHVHC